MWNRFCDSLAEVERNAMIMRADSASLHTCLLEFNSCAHCAVFGEGNDSTGITAANVQHAGTSDGELGHVLLERGDDVKPARVFACVKILPGVEVVGIPPRGAGGFQLLEIALFGYGSGRPHLSVGCFVLVRWVRLAMQLDKKTLGISVEPALSNLIGVDLYEGVVAAFFLDTQLKSAKEAGERPRACGVCAALERKSWEKSIGDAEHVGGSELSPEEMPHDSVIVRSDCSPP